MANPAVETAIGKLEEKLSRRIEGRHPFTLTPAWWQERLLDWATTDPDFRVKLLQFVDVLPTLRTARAVADHVRQYFRGAHPSIVGAASGLAARPVFRPVLSRVVREGVFAMARRFIAGATPLEAVPALRELAQQGVGYTMDLLGEATLSDVEADAYLGRYLDLLETLSGAGLPGPVVGSRPELWAGVPPVNVSVKLSALSQHLEPAAPEYVSEVTRRRLRPLLRRARELGAFINFDMEQYRYKDLVHRSFADLLLEPEFADYPHVGIVVQAYLHDSLDDLQRVAGLAGRRGAPITVRLVKGAYWDEEVIVADQNSWPVPVFQVKADTDASFERCTDALLQAWPHLRPAFGTQNPRSIAQAAVKAGARGLGRHDLEFQVLFGMAEGLREAVAEEGYRTRVYVPIGQVIPGMAYLVRRLLENTSNQAWFNVAVSKEAAVGEKQRAGVPAAEPAAFLPRVSREEFLNAPPAPFHLPETRRRMLESLDAARRQFGASYPLLVDGRPVAERSHVDVRYPAEPEVVVGRVAQATLEDVEAAVAAAREALPAWRDLPARQRADILHRAADLMEARRFELAATMVFESAKPWHEADGDVIEAIDYLRYYALWGRRLSEPRLTQEILGERNEHFHEGRGVTAVISPWNFPLAIIAGMSVGALAGGNCAIFKPAGPSPIIAYKLIRLLLEAGVPEGAVQYLPGPGGQIGRALVEHPGVDNIAFTGSKDVGLGIIEAARRLRPGQRNVKRVVAEMGGKNAIIIDDDADLDLAVAGVVVSAFGYAGQKCSACSRLIIVGAAYDEAVERLRNAVASLVVGPPHDAATFVPPVISAQARDNILGYIETGRATSRLLVQTDIWSRVSGRSPTTGGEAPRREDTVRPGAGEPGYYVPPTVFTEVPLESPLACEEIFGPVLSVFRARDFQEALDFALRSEYALTGGVFSRNPRHIETARRRFRVGNLYINRKITGAVVGRHPFGGLGMSGLGEKAGGPDYVRQFMEPRTVSENTMRRGFAPEEWE